MTSPAASRAPIARPDEESRAWVERLRPESSDREAAIDELHGLLLKAARFEIRRRAAASPHLRGGDDDDLARQSAHDALVAVLAKLDGFRGESRFTTWAYKFALLEAAVKIRRREWQGREVPLEPEGWALIPDGASLPQHEVEQGELFAALRSAIANDLTSRQREVLVAIAIRGVPIDVLSERLHTTRGALYKTLHDARRKLRAALAERGLDADRHVDDATVRR